MRKITGAHTAIITPFTKDNKINEDGLRHNIRFQISNGIDGIVALGTTGETPTLSSKEKEKIIRICVDEINGKIPLMIGCGTYSTQQTIENTQQAEQLGADFALIVTPYYNKPTQEGIYRHFKAISEASSLPICIYNIQGRTGLNLQTDTLKRLSEIPNIISVKEASSNISQMMEVVETIVNSRNDFSMMCGDDVLTLPSMAIGGHGIISVVSNLFPKQIKELVQALVRKDFDTAREIHYRLLPIFRGAFIETNPIPIKTAMNMCGMPSGNCRMPLCELTPENEKKLRNILHDLEIIDAGVGVGVGV